MVEIFERVGPPANPAADQFGRRLLYLTARRSNGGEWTAEGPLADLTNSFAPIEIAARTVAAQRSDSRARLLPSRTSRVHTVRAPLPPISRLIDTTTEIDRSRVTITTHAVIHPREPERADYQLSVLADDETIAQANLTPAAADPVTNNDFTFQREVSARAGEPDTLTIRAPASLIDPARQITLVQTDPAGRESSADVNVAAPPEPFGVEILAAAWDHRLEGAVIAVRSDARVDTTTITVNAVTDGTEVGRSPLDRQQPDALEPFEQPLAELIVAQMPRLRPPSPFSTEPRPIQVHATRARRSTMIRIAVPLPPVLDVDVTLQNPDGAVARSIQID